MGGYLMSRYDAALYCFRYGEFWSLGECWKQLCFYQLFKLFPVFPTTSLLVVVALLQCVFAAKNAKGAKELGLGLRPIRLHG